MKPIIDNKSKKEKSVPSQPQNDSASQYLDPMEQSASQRESLEQALENAKDELSTAEKWVEKALDAATREQKVDPKKIADLKAKIASGTYQVKSEAIAKKFVEEQLGVTEVEE